MLVAYQIFTFFVDGVTLNNFATKEQQRLLEVRRAERASGGDVSESGTRNIAITSGVFYSGLSRAIFPAFDSSATDTFSSVYQDGVGGYTVLDGKHKLTICIMIMAQALLLY